jgi:hypothetical protein
MENYGHPNYSIMAYAVSHGHLDCVKKLHLHDALWHTDIAGVSIEKEQFECFKYIIEYMAIEENGSIDINENDFSHIQKLDNFKKYVNDNMKSIKKYLSIIENI